MVLWSIQNLNNKQVVLT